MRRTVLGVLCATLALAALAVAIVGVGDIAGGAGPAAYAAMVFVLGTATGAGYGAYRCFQPRRSAELGSAQTLLQLAARSGGSLTVVDVVSHTGLPVPQAQRSLEALVHHRLADVIVTESGTELFRIKGALSPAEKHAARDILDS